LQAVAGQIPARQAGDKAAIPLKVLALTINKVCLSGLDAIALAGQLIRAGKFEIQSCRSARGGMLCITYQRSMADRFATALDCADISFLTYGTLDELPLPSRVGATRTGGIDLNKPRIRAALAAALAAAPHGFTVAEHAARARGMTGHAGYTIRQASYDLRKLRGKGLAVKPAATRRYHIPPEQARTIAALLTLRAQVTAPMLVGVRSPSSSTPIHRMSAATSSCCEIEMQRGVVN
jgi:thiolase-like protein